MALKLACSEERFWETSWFGWNQQEECMLSLPGSLCYHSLAAQIFQLSEFASVTWVWLCKLIFWPEVRGPKSWRGLSAGLREEALGAFLPINLFFFPFGSRWWFSKINTAYLFREFLFKKKEKEWEEKANRKCCLSNICVIKYLEVWGLKVRDGATSFH